MATAADILAFTGSAKNFRDGSISIKMTQILSKLSWPRLLAWAAQLLL
jgi:hypothetical protein